MRISILVSHVFFFPSSKRTENTRLSLGVCRLPRLLGFCGSAVLFNPRHVLKGLALFAYKKTAANGTDPKFDTCTFTTTYLSLPFYIMIILGYRFVTKSKLVKPKEADSYGGKLRIDAEDSEFLAQQAEQKVVPETKLQRVYRRK
jgi:amino acid transporter